MAYNYKLLTEGIEARINPEHLAVQQDFARELSTIRHNDMLTYVRLAMKGVDPEYTKRSVAAGEAAKGHLKAIEEVRFAYQGSVMTNTHIKANSDIDLLILTNKFYSYDYANINQAVNSAYSSQHYYQNQLNLLKEEVTRNTYKGSIEEDLRKLRSDSERILQGVYNTCDITHAKAIKIRNRGIGRDVDVVVSNYYDDVTSVVNSKGSYRGIQVYDKYTHQRSDPDYPFLSIERINERGNETVGRMKKMIRFLKNMKAKSQQEIKLSSFDFNAICYDIAPSVYKNLIFYQLVPVLYRHIKSICDDPSHANRLVSVDGREHIFRDNPDKLVHLRYILSELQAVYNDLIQSGTL
ncbi:hypothetical protein E4631_24365 [Hymenobacter sp. UV11]|uniref:nucleotidyltransferase domain-containing protein n=1 Tax=Hymenobacter sp. UV11 TaxID=1849735 RepID=UPI00105D8E5F|nr:nucleotidyltransferase domain-containing protein [Hymenobacter sp. UV11]TDN39898.1 hypothetical protein A8B98_16475 [Hymenobacter sp. UV11]TFZ62855.1 hypothetical protein E4631_24365 [Hymenobacter sp. UV11]